MHITRYDGQGIYYNVKYNLRSWLKFPWRKKTKELIRTRGEFLGRCYSEACKKLGEGEK